MSNTSTAIAPAVQRDDNALLTASLSQEQANFLLQRTPTNEIKYRQGRGGQRLAYVEHGYVTELLNKVFGFNWDFEITDKQILEDEVLVEARLTVRTPAGQTIVKTQFGGADIKRFTTGPKSGRPLSIADDYKAAGSDALKKCASLLGIGLDLYGRDRSEPDDVAPERPAEPERTPAERQYLHIVGQLRQGGWTARQISVQQQLVTGDSRGFRELDGAAQAQVLDKLESMARQSAGGQEDAG